MLVSLHPDYVMVHRLVPLAVDRTRIECSWAFAPESLQRPGFDPGYAVEFWDITNRQDWHACESVQRGLSSPHARPGPLSPDEDAVYQFVTMVARGYRGQPVWNPGRGAVPTASAASGGLSDRIRRAKAGRPVRPRARTAPGRRPRPSDQASEPGPRLVIWRAMIARWTSLVPSQIRSTRSSR